MDRFIASFDSRADGDLTLCENNGVAYQTDREFRVDVPYYEKCAGYAGTDIAQELNAGRRDFVNKHVGAEESVLDVGVGSGEFIAWRPHTWGYDVDEAAVKWLKASNKWCEHFAWFRAFTFWDVLEHVEDPENSYFRYMFSDTKLFCSLPIFGDLTRIRKSKHYRPGEHLYYWTERGFVDWMRMHKFELIECSDFETAIGREQILTFVFERRVQERRT